MKAVDEAFAWAKTQNQTLKQALREDRDMKLEDVKAEWIAAAEAVLVPGKPMSTSDFLRALAAVIPLIQKEEREADEVAVSETAGTYPPLSKEQYALIEAMAAIRARGEP